MSVYYKLQDNHLWLNVTSTSIAVRICLYVLGALCVLLPIGAPIVSMMFGFDVAFTILQLIVLLVMTFVGLFFFRLGLWNTYGQEEFHFGETTISYQASYGWFKDKRKKYTIEGKQVAFSYQPIGFIEDRKAVLIISIENSKVGSAVKVPIDQLDQICDVLNAKYAS